jgi:hypothetical protein
MLARIKANMVFSVDLKSFYKSIWIGPLLITWFWNEVSSRPEEIVFVWYGFNYWMPQEVDFED